MVSSVDGAAAVAGRVGALSGSVDDHLLHVLRDLSDVVLVGAGTIRAEGYGPCVVPVDMQQRRRDRGEPAVPPLAVITRRVDLDLSAPLFAAALSRPLMITTASAPPDRLAAAGDVAEVIVVGDDRVDLAGAIAALTGLGLPRILCEGGPHLLAQLYAAGHVDERA